MNDKDLEELKKLWPSLSRIEKYLIFSRAYLVFITERVRLSWFCFCYPWIGIPLSKEILAICL